MYVLYKLYKRKICELYIYRHAIITVWCSTSRRGWNQISTSLSKKPLNKIPCFYPRAYGFCTGAPLCHVSVWLLYGCALVPRRGVTLEGERRAGDPRGWRISFYSYACCSCLISFTHFDTRYFCICVRSIKKHHCCFYQLMLAQNAFC